ncbi:GH19175 [Drosophila grimshawi]|uniref:GH19175 n=1 Tax=Drosophila grimshawi TaxID=7222 RepID=B4JS02_DROGR|nr:GH19175 [Drosophila grimshawi]
MDEVGAGSAAASATKKSGTTLSVDRAAFLLLRVKKAFKKKRQQRKERQAQQSAGGGGGVGSSGAQSRSGSRKLPPPLLRSRTLPAIIVPGLPLVSLHTDKHTFHLDERLLGCKSRSGSASGHRWSLLTRGSGGGGGGGSGAGVGGSGSGSGHNNNNSNLTNNNNNTLMVKSLNLPKDDSSLIYRRKSSGSSPHAHAAHAAVMQHQYQQHVADSSLFHLSDDFECHADGSLLLRIPAPHGLASSPSSRGYHPCRLAAKKRATACSEATTPLSRDHQHPHQHLHDFAMADAGGSGSGSGSSSSASGAQTTFTRLAKLLHQSSAITARSNLQPSVYMEAPQGEEAPRRLSWERYVCNLCVFIYIVQKIKNKKIMNSFCTQNKYTKYCQNQD